MLTLKHYAAFVTLLILLWCSPVCGLADGAGRRPRRRPFRPPWASVYGDVNGDGRVTVLDLLIVRDHVLAGTYSRRADVNHDRLVNESDIAIIRDIILTGGARGGG